MKKDYRENQKVIATILLEDKGQDFVEIDVLENGVILGNSIMFEEGRLSMIGIGTLDGIEYWSFDELKKDLANKNKPVGKIYIYIKRTEEEDPLPWEAKNLNYQIIDIKKPEKPNRFLNKSKK